MRKLRRHHNERGSALVISLLVLLVLTGIGLSYTLQSKTETQIAGNDTRWSQALFNTEAGLAEGLARMATAADTANYVGQPLNQVNPGWGVYIVDAIGSSAEDPQQADLATDGFDNDLDGMVDEAGETYPEVLTKQASSDAIPYTWVKVEYVRDNTGAVVRFGDHDLDVTTPQQLNTLEGAPVIRIQAEGTRGTANRSVEIEAVKPGLDLPRAALYTEDDDFQWNGTQFLISGQDYDPSLWAPVAAANEVPGIVTTADPQNIDDGLTFNQRNNVEGEGAEPSVDSSPIDLDMQELYDTYASEAEIIKAPGTYGNEVWGGLDDYKIVRVDGSLHVSGGVVGGGILLVNGDFECTGQFTWYGLIVVLGDIRFSGGGASIHIFGTTLVQGGIDKQSIGGNADILYSSEALRRLANLGRYLTVSWMEI